jgi:predicted TIM-barrel fold metal-dependent hydrolase
MNVQIIDANTTVGAHPSHRLDMSVESLVARMDNHQIAASLTLSTIGIFYNHVQGNAATIEAARASNRLVPVATVNPKDYFGTAADMQSIRTQGFRIAKFFPAQQGWCIDSAAFAEVLRQLAPLKMPIMLDAATPGEPSSIARMIQDYPAPVILCSISLDVLSESIAVMAQQPNVMLETHDLHVPGALQMLAQRVGSDRVVFGSGAPMRSVPSSLQYVLSSDLSDEDKQRVLGGNIRRILEAV